jgi:hypothetical protein
MVEHWDELPPEQVRATALRIFDLLEELLRGGSR